MPVRDLGSVKRTEDAYDKILDAVMKEAPSAKSIAIRLTPDPPPGKGARVDVWTFPEEPNHGAKVDMGIAGDDVVWFEKG